MPHLGHGGIACMSRTLARSWGRNDRACVLPGTCMAGDEGLNERVRKISGDHGDVTEKRMCSGTCFMLNGNMLCAVNRERMMFRVGKDQNDEALERGATPVEVRGHVMGYVERMLGKTVKRGKAPVVQS